MLANGIRRAPIFSRPHAHVLGFIIGGGAGWQYGNAKVRVNEILEHEMKRAGRDVPQRQ